MAEQNQRRNGASNNGNGGEFSDEVKHLMSAVAGRVLSGTSDRVGGITERLTGMAEGNDSAAAALGKAGEKKAEGKSSLTAGLSAGAEGIKSSVKKAFNRGGGGGGKKQKVTNIIEQIDVGAPIDLVYDQWTQFQDYSKFMKKVEDVDQNDEQKLTFKAQILWSHRTWEATIVEQVPDSRIVWRSKGEKGRVDGAVTFHELAPDLTRVLVVLEYHPQGLFEHTGNLWRAQGRRVRLELKHFRRQVMTESLLHPDDVQGWRGEIHDSSVTKSDEDVRAEEEETDGEYDDEYSEDDEYDEGDEYDEDDEGDEDGSEDADDDTDRPRRSSRSRRPARAGGRR